MLKANFKITETGGTGIVQLQFSSDSGSTWHDVSTSLTLTHGALTVNDTTDVEIDTSIFIPGETYRFRLADTAGSPVSSVHTFTIPSIKQYVSAHEMIGFVHTTGDNWQVSFHSNPISQQSNSGVTITGYDYKIKFNTAGSSLELDSATMTSDYTTTCSNHGAGIYDLVCQYNFSNGMVAFIKRLVKVDGAGNIIADIQFNGTSVDSMSGLTISETAYITQVGVGYDIVWLAAGPDGDDSVQIGSGTSATMTLPTGTALVMAVVDIDADTVFADYQGDPIIGHMITIS